MDKLEEKEKKLREKQVRKNFIEERRKANPKPSHTIGSNNKINERIATILNILSELLGEWGRTGLRLHELVERTGKSKPTIFDNLNDLQSMGVVIKEDEKWKAAEEAGSFYRDLQEPFGFLDFKPVQIKTFDDKPLFPGNVPYTGSIWTNQYTKEKDPAKIISKGQAGLIIIKPAGGQPPKL